MDCRTARETISALLDDEPPGIDGQALEAHLVGCAACRRWRENAHLVTRRFRLSPARAAAMSAHGTLAAVAAGVGPQRRLRRIALLRFGLASISLAQLTWVTVPALLFGDRGAPIHVSHEMGSFDMALAVGFLVAAWRPARAQGMRALVGAAALFLVLTATVDLAGEHTSASEEAPHLLAVAGWLLLRQLAARMPFSDADNAPALPRFLGVGPRRTLAPAPLDGIRVDESISGVDRVNDELAA